MRTLESAPGLRSITGRVRGHGAQPGSISTLTEIHFCHPDGNSDGGGLDVGRLISEVALGEVVADSDSSLGDRLRLEMRLRTATNNI